MAKSTPRRQEAPCHNAETVGDTPTQPSQMVYYEGN